MYCRVTAAQWTKWTAYLGSWSEFDFPTYVMALTPSVRRVLDGTPWDDD